MTNAIKDASKPIDKLPRELTDKPSRELTENELAHVSGGNISSLRHEAKKSVIQNLRS